MFTVSRLLAVPRGHTHVGWRGLSWTPRAYRLFHWNQMLAFTNINEMIGPQLKSTHKTQSLFSDKNLISMTDKGFHVLMPFVVRALEKLIQLIDQEMTEVGAQKLVMPSLVSKQLWEQSGRWQKAGQELFRVTDRNKTELCLAPTHEEVITNLVAITKYLTENQLPLYLYQITSKFRDEAKAKHGLLRGREFLMKDLYTFDANLAQAKITYEVVCNAYQNIFRLLGLPVIKARGSVGNIGGQFSHEFLLPSDLGEDHVFICQSCQTSFNRELCEDSDDIRCVSCGSSALDTQNAIEVGHSFLLGDYYSSKFEAKYSTKDSSSKMYFTVNPFKFLINPYIFSRYEMGCYGLGVTRILAAAVQVLSEEYSLRWPLAIAPFKICLVLPEKRSKAYVESAFVLDFAKSLSDSLGEDIFIDDRIKESIGKRLMGLTTLGFPYIIVGGKRITEEIPRFEVIDSYNKTNNFFTHLECNQFFERVIQTHN